VREGPIIRRIIRPSGARCFPLECFDLYQLALMNRFCQLLAGATCHRQRFQRSNPPRPNTVRAERDSWASPVHLFAERLGIADSHDFTVSRAKATFGLMKTQHMPGRYCVHPVLRFRHDSDRKLENHFLIVSAPDVFNADRTFSVTASISAQVGANSSALRFCFRLQIRLSSRFVKLVAGKFRMRHRSNCAKASAVRFCAAIRRTPILSRR